MEQEWLNTGSHSFCPKCHSPDVRVRQVIQLCDQPFSLSGVHAKLQDTWEWEYRCFACGDEGPCEIRESTTARLDREAAEKGWDAPAHEHADGECCDFTCPRWQWNEEKLKEEERGL